MSKLFKDLKYDEDRIPMLGDPVIVSRDSSPYGPSKLAPSGKTWVSTYPEQVVDQLYFMGTTLDGLRYADNSSGYYICMVVQFDAEYNTLLAGNAQHAYIWSYDAVNMNTGGHTPLHVFDTGKMVPVFKLPAPTSDSTYDLIYTINSEIVFQRNIDSRFKHLFYDTDTIKIKINTSVMPMPAVLELCGREYSGTIEPHTGYTTLKLTSRTLAYADQIPTNSHDADKVISPSGVTVVRSLDNGTATITHPGTSGSLGSPVVTFSSDFSFGTISNYAGTTISTEGPYTVAGSWTVWIKQGDTVPTDVGGIMSKEFIIAAPSSTLCMFFNEGSDFANVQNIDTQNPTVNLYGSGVTGSATMVRNYADVTERMLTESDIVALFSSSGLTINGTTYKAQPAS